MNSEREQHKETDRNQDTQKCNTNTSIKHTYTTKFHEKRHKSSTPNLC